MKISKLGPINKSDFVLNKLTIFTGKNNQGKTHVSYAIYGMLKSLESFPGQIFTDDDADYLNENGYFSMDINKFQDSLVLSIKESISKNWSKILAENFHTEESYFEKSKLILSDKDIFTLIGFENFNDFINESFDMVLDLGVTSYKFSFKKETIDIIKIVEDTIDSNNSSEINYQFPTKYIMNFFLNRFLKQTISTFYIPAERVGLNVFRSQLNSNKIKLMDSISSHFNQTSEEAQLNNALSKYQSFLSKPINDYLKFINGIEKYKINDEDDSLGRFIRDKLINGRFDVDKANDKSYFRIKYGNARYKTQSIPLHITSSSVKSFYGLDYYLEGIDFSQTNFLIIDEPEMNLHPAAQVEFVNLLESLITKGINVLISTHSDFIIKKLQNVALNNKNNKNTVGITPENVSLFDFHNGNVNLINLFKHNNYENFNKVMNELEEEYISVLDFYDGDEDED